jgi:Uma2 family endonuclease
MLINMLREPPVNTAATFQAFLELEKTSQVRHEFVDGNLFVMAGGTDRHNFIALLLSSKLLPVTLEHNYRPYINDVLVQTPTGHGYYPDVFVTRDSPTDEPRVKRHPIIIVEVLSDSTEAIDRGEKWQHYQQIPTLNQYVLISQHEPRAEIFLRQADGLWLYEQIARDGKLIFSSLNFELELNTLFENLP